MQTKTTAYMALCLLKQDLRLTEMEQSLCTEPNNLKKFMRSLTMRVHANNLKLYGGASIYNHWNLLP